MMDKRMGVLFLALMCLSITAQAARPSFTSLQQQINQQQAQINSLTSLIYQSKNLVVRDSSGAIVGDHASLISPDIGFIYFDVNNRIYSIIAYRGSFSYDYLHYDGSGCSGSAYVIKDLYSTNGMSGANISGVRNGIAYGPSLDQTNQQPQVQIISSWREDSGCSAASQIITPEFYAPAEQVVDLTGYNLPLKFGLTQ